MSPTRASALHVVPAPRPRVTFIEERASALDDPKVLERLARDVRAARYRVATLLQAGEFSLLTLEKPNVKPEELKAAMRWRIKDLLEYGVDEAIIDTLDIPGDGAGRPAMLYVVAARRETIRQVVDRFEAAKVNLSVIDVPDTAQRNIAALYETEGRALMTLSFDARGGLMTVTAGGELYVSRRLEYGTELLETGSEDERGQLGERILLELQRSLDNFERSNSSVAIDRVLIAPGPGMEFLASHLGPSLYLPVSVLRLDEAIDLPPDCRDAAPDVQSTLFRLIGAGLRTENARQ